MTKHLPNAGTLPPRIQTATFFIDESGSKSTANKCFVVAGIKTREPDILAREILSIREQTGFTHEFKFGRLTASSLAAFSRLVEVLEDSDVRIAATVVDGAAHNPFKGAQAWQVHARIISQLVVGNINRGEAVTVLMDGISVPTGCAMGTTVQRTVNRRLGATAVVSAVSLDSRTNDLLQAADMVAGAIYHRRTRSRRERDNEHKSKIVRRLTAAFELPTEACDHRSERVNIATFRGRPSRNPRLTVIRNSSNAS